MECKYCSAPIPAEQIDEGSSVVVCPHCRRSQEIDESESLKIERIRAKNYKDTEIGKHKVEKDAEVAEKVIELEEKKVGLKKIKTVILFLVIIAIAAFAIWKGNAIRHRDDIKIVQEAASFNQMNYETAHSIFEDAGFKDIQYDKQATLSKKDKKYEDLVTQVSVNGNTSFKANTWFPKDSAVKITYRVLDPEKASEVQIPESAVYFGELDYVKVCEDLKDAGFENIVLCPKYDVKFYEGSKSGTIQSITIGGKSDFSEEDWMPYDSKVRIIYRAKKLDYEGENYKEIKKKLDTIGFVDVTCVPMNDLKSGKDKKAGKVKSILINDVEFDEASDLNIFSPVFIKYHSEKKVSDSQIKVTEASKKLKGKDYKDTVAALEKMGFSNIETVPLGDLKKGILHKDGRVKEVSIDGKTKFKAGEIFSKDAAVIVSYHSYPKD